MQYMKLQMIKEMLVVSDWNQKAACIFQLSSLQFWNVFNMKWLNTFKCDVVILQSITDITYVHWICFTINFFWIFWDF